MRPNVLIAEAASLISQSRFGCLPVVEADGTLVGVVTENDFVKLLAARDAHTEIRSK